jgi:hypothetical protein
MSARFRPPEGVLPFSAIRTEDRSGAARLACNTSPTKPSLRGRAPAPDVSGDEEGDRHDAASPFRSRTHLVAAVSAALGGADARAFASRLTPPVDSPSVVIDASAKTVIAPAKTLPIGWWECPPSGSCEVDLALQTRDGH